MTITQILVRKSLLLIVSLVPLFVNTPGAWADICFQYGTGGGVSVAKGLATFLRLTLANG
jgi:hypothetical protein